MKLTRAALALFLLAGPLAQAATPAPPPGQGAVRLRCQTTVRDCSILSEAPAGLGLGQAALDRLTRFAIVSPRPAGGGAFELDFSPPLDAGQAAAPAPAAGPTYGPGDWRQQPTRTQFLGRYPPKALAEKVAGTVVMDCKVTTTGGVNACKVTEETPAGAGFGKAAAGMAEYFRFAAKQVDGRPVEGAATIIVLFEP